MVERRPSVLVGALLEIAHEQRVDGQRSLDSPPLAERIDSLTPQQIYENLVRGWEWAFAQPGNGWDECATVVRAKLKALLAVQDFGERPTPEPEGDSRAVQSGPGTGEQP